MPLQSPRPISRHSLAKKGIHQLLRVRKMPYFLPEISPFEDSRPIVRSVDIQDNIHGLGMIYGERILTVVLGVGVWLSA